MRINQRAQAYPAHLGRFLWSWVQNPAGVGALAPSGRELSRLMVQDILPGSRVLELGAGTGTVTRAILDAGVEPQDLDIVEVDPQFVRMLRMRFDKAAIHEIDATTMARQLMHLSGSLDYVVSGLPLLLLSRVQRMRILAGAFALLSRGGMLHQFTYGGRCPVDSRMLEKLGLTARRIGVAARNFPPAFVYRITRSRDGLR